MSSYNVFLAEYIGAPRNHHAIFVETHERGEGSGRIVQATGDIQNGMEFEEKQARKPDDSATYMGKELLGIIDAGDMERLIAICQDIPPPKKQFDGPKRLYPHEPLRRCQEWTQEAVEALRSKGVLHQ